MNPLHLRTMLSTGILVIASSCASGNSAGSRPADSADSSTAQADRPQNLQENVRTFRREVEGMLESMAQRKSVEDPDSFRARLLKGERRLSAYAKELRGDIQNAPPPAPAPATSSTNGQKLSDEERQRLLDELEQTEAKLETIRKQLDSSERPPNGAP